MTPDEHIRAAEEHLLAFKRVYGPSTENERSLHRQANLIRAAEAHTELARLITQLGRTG